MKIKYIGQHDKCDCGAASLAMVASFYRLYYPLQKFREATKTTKTGTSLYGLVEGSKRLGFEAEALKGTQQELLKGITEGEILLPFIAHMARGHYVVVAGVKKDSILMFDPEFGKKLISGEQFFQEWSGYIVHITPGTGFRQGNYKPGVLKKIMALLLPQWKKLGIIFFFSLLIYLVGIFSSFTFETLMDELSLENKAGTEYAGEVFTEDTLSVENPQSEIKTVFSKLMHGIYAKAGSLHVFFAVLIVVYLTQGILSYVRGRVVIALSKRLDFSLTFRYYRKLLHLPVEEKNTRSNGDYLSRFSDSYRIRYAISNAAVSLMVDLTMAALGGVLLFKINKAMFCVTMGMLSLYFLGVLAFRRKLVRSNQQVMVKNAEMQSYLKEVLEGAESIKSNAVEAEVDRQGGKKYNSMIESYYRNDGLALKESTLLGLIEMFGNLGILWIGFTLAAAGQIALGELITFVMLLSYFTEPLKNIVLLQPTLQSAMVAIERIFDVFDIRQEETASGEVSFIHGDISIRDISFAYASGETVFEKFSLDIPMGSKMAITGESGSGKTTLMKLLLRLYLPQKGSIIVNGQPVERIALTELRRHICYVDQKPFLFENTILYNLTWGQCETEQEEIQRVCRSCCIHDYIVSLPKGYETLVSENGESLSQGQKQRIALARAILRKPSVLILDEAMSNIDLTTIKEIVDRTRHALEKCTVIFISHSPEVLRECDTLVEMKDGSVRQVITRGGKKP